MPNLQTYYFKLDWIEHFIISITFAYVTWMTMFNTIMYTRIWASVYFEVQQLTWIDIRNFSWNLYQNLVLF